MPRLLVQLLVTVSALWCGAAAQAGPAKVAGSVTADQCARAAAYSSAQAGTDVLVLHDGIVVCETYNGSNANSRHETWSGTKSFVGIMLAAAVQDGLLSLDELVGDTIPEWKDDAWRSRVTIRMVLSLSLGMPSIIGKPPTYAEAVALPLRWEPGTRFAYGGAPYQLFGEIMRRKLIASGQGGSPVDYLRRRILEPIGLNNVVWRSGIDGNPLLPQGAILTASEWATFGEFVRHGAKKDGRALVDESAFAELFKPSPANPAYGITWWLPSKSAPTDRVSAMLDFHSTKVAIPPDTVIAAGAGSQRLYVIPSRHLTIVRFAHFKVGDATVKWSDSEFLGRLLAIQP